MRIAQVSTLSAPVRRDAPGSVESLVWLLSEEFVRLGHEVTVFGTAGSDCAGTMVATLPGPYGAPGSYDDWQLCEWVNLARAVERAREFDIIHSHAYLWGLPLQGLTSTPLAHTLHIVPDQNQALLRRQFPAGRVAALSRHQWSEFPDLPPAAVIPHGVDPSEFTLRSGSGDYLLYLGRFVSGKGPLHAIACAQALGMRLVLAGPQNHYFREQIWPRIDGNKVEYAGYVSGRARDELIGNARALVYPIQHPEAFGLVLVEAMLCGTPVAAVRLGAVPEIVEDGVTGCLADGMGDFYHAVERTLKLDRPRIRQEAERRFSVREMARAYLQFYESCRAQPISVVA